MAFVIRKATLDDLERLSQIGAATFLEGFTAMINGDDLLYHCKHQHSVEVYQKYLERERTAAWIAEHDVTGAPVGYALLCPPELPIETAQTDLEVKRIYLFATAQGSGTADALMNACETHARAIGAASLHLGTYEGNERAVGFYRKRGFEITGKRQFNVGNQVFDDIVMSKSI